MTEQPMIERFDLDTLQLLQFLRHGTIAEEVDILLEPMPELAAEAWEHPERATGLLEALDDDVLLGLWDEAPRELREELGRALTDSLMVQAAALHEQAEQAQAVAAGLPTDTDRLQRLPGLPTDPGRLRELAMAWESAVEFLQAQAVRLQEEASR